MMMKYNKIRTKLVFLLILVGVMCTGCTVQADLESNCEGTALEDVIATATQGDATAQYNLGYCYHYGIGVEQDLEKAVYWCTLAAEQGFASAQYNLGDFYSNGRGVKQDLEKAVEWYTKSAEQGFA